MEFPGLVVLIFEIFILDVKIVKIDWAEAGRNSSGPDRAALGHLPAPPIHRLY